MALYIFTPTTKVEEEEAFFSVFFIFMALWDEDEEAIKRQIFFFTNSHETHLAPWLSCICVTLLSLLLYIRLQDELYHRNN